MEEEEKEKAEAKQLKRKKRRERNKERRRRRLKRRKEQRKAGIKKENFVVTKSNYYKYLRSAWWKETRAHFLIENNQCYVCGKKKKLQVHHKTYKRVGKEQVEDLICLCKDCHEVVHKYARDNKKNSVTIENAADRLKEIMNTDCGLDIFLQIYQARPLR